MVTATVAAIRMITGDVYGFQQDNAPAHRACETVALLQRTMPAFIESTMQPANSPDLNPVDYKAWGWMHNCAYQQPVVDTDQLREGLLQVWV